MTHGISRATGYVIINGERNTFFAGFAQDGSAVWTTNKQSAELYEEKFAVRDAAKIRSTDDENARVLQVRIDRNGYIR